jgi:hypothetical protein
VQFYINATDDVSTASSIPTVCGPLVFTNLLSLPFMLIDQAAGSITVKTNDMSLIGSHNATMRAALLNYPSSVPADISFTINLIDPCLTTVLSLPSLQTINITSFTASMALSQSFAPATDSAATIANVVDLCGPRVYSIVEQQPSLFIEIGYPANNFTQNLTLSAYSMNFSDCGNWQPTL